MSKWSEFLYSFSASTQPIIEQLLDDSSLSITDFDALKGLSTASLLSKLVAGTTTNPCLKKELATCLTTSHVPIDKVLDYSLNLSNASNEKWNEFKLSFDQVWHEVIEGFKNDVSSEFITSYPGYESLFHSDLLPLIGTINTDVQLGYANFSAFKADSLATLKTNIGNLNSSSDFIIELSDLLMNKTGGSGDWNGFETSSFPTDSNLTSLLGILRQDMEGAAVNYSTFSSYDAGGMANSIVNNGGNFLDHLAQYLYFNRDCTWNNFKMASNGTVKAMIGTFTGSSECFNALANMIIPQAQNFEFTITGDYAVKGLIVDLNGVPLVGKKVKVSDKNYKDMVQVGSTFTTNLDGEYGIGFYKIHLGDPDKDAPDLEIEVFDTDGTTSLRKAPCILNAKEETIMNLAVGSGSYTGMVEFEIMHRKLNRVIGNNDISTDGSCDITNLANRFNFGVERTSQYFQARIYNQMAPTVEIEVFYGLMREGISSNLGTLMLQPSGTLVSALLKAANNNIIKRKFKEEVPSATASAVTTWAHDSIATLKALFSDLVLDGSFGISDYLQSHFDNIDHITTGLTTSRKEEVIQIFGDTEDRLKDGSLFWANLASESSLTLNQRNALELSITLSTVLHNNYEFGADLIQTDNVSDIETIIAYDTTDWQGKLTSHSVEIPEEYDDEADYIIAIQQHLETAFPSEYLVARLDEQSIIPKSDLLLFFSNNPSFDLDEDHLSKHLIDNPTALSGASNETLLKTNIAALIRLYRICPNYNKINVLKALWDEDIKSASQILLLGEASFIRKFESVLSEPQLKVIFSNAINRASKALHIYSNESQKHTNVLPAVIPKNIIDSESVPTEYDEMAAEFSSGDFCACKSCQSIFGPAAYLHDLLIWMNGILDSGDVTKTKSVLDALSLKRPELESILLNCDNTNIEIPYIDLVIELLEYLVTKHQDSPDWSPYSNESAFLSRQTSFSSEELKAFPEHQISDVYSEILPKTLYPWNTGGFELWEAEAEQFLKYFNLSRLKLAEVISDDGGSFVSGDDLTCFRLGISKMESAIIRLDSSAYTHGTISLHDIYGYESQSSMAADMFDINSPAPITVSILLRRSGLSLDQFIDYISTRFINPTGKEVTFDSASCNLDDASIDLNATELEHLFQFYRFHQKYNGSVQELDFAIGGNTSITNAVLTQIADIKRLADHFSLPLEEVCIWYNGFDTYEIGSSKSQYAKIFLDELSISNIAEIDPHFKLNSGLTDLFSSNLTDFESNGIVKKHLKNILGINDDDYENLKILLEIDSETPQPIASIQRNLEELGHLYSYTSQSKALGVSLSEFVMLRKLIDISLTPGDFIMAAEKVLTGPFSVAETNYLLLGESSVKDGTGILKADIADVLTLTRSSLKAEFPSLFVPVAGDFKDAVLAAIDIYKEARIEDWLNDSHIQGLINRIERVVDGSTDSESFTSFKLDLASLGCNETEELDPLFSILFDSTATGTYIDPSTHMNDRYEIVAELFRSSLFRLATYKLPGQEIVTKTIATWLGEEEHLIESILLANEAQIMANILDYDSFFRKSNDIATESAYQPLIDQIEALYKVALTATKIGLPARHISLFYSSSAPFDFSLLIVDPEELNTDDLDNWLNLPTLAKQNRSYSGGTDLLDFLASDPSNKDLLISITGWDAGMIGVVGESSLTSADLLAMINAKHLLNTSGISYSKLTEWNVVEMDQSVANSITLAVKEKAIKKGGLNDVAQMRDELKVQKRNALVNYLIAFTKEGEDFVYNDSFDIYDQLLADPEMGTCMPSSRIKFATLSAQLFIHKILLGTEVSPEDSTKTLNLGKQNLEEWEWRENYRVWEANRKVFTYPENWMDPDLRDDKTELFKKMEDALSQIEATNENVSDIFIDYVEGLDDIARLEIAQTFYEPKANTLHVFARTKGTKRKYYYRTYIDNAFWTEWKEVSVEITSNHLIPIVWNERLMLLWPTFKEQADVPEVVKEGDTVQSEKQIILNWSILKGDKWTAPNSSLSYVSIPDAVPESCKDQLFYTARVQEGILRVSIFQRNGKAIGTCISIDNQLDLHVLKEFAFRNGMDTNPIIESHTLEAEAFNRNQRFTTFGDGENQKFTSTRQFPYSSLNFNFQYCLTSRNEDDISVNILDDIKKKQAFKLTIPHQYVGPYKIRTPRTNRIPLFFEDDNRTFFINQKIKKMNRTASSIDSFTGVILDSLEISQDHSYGSTVVSAAPKSNSSKKNSPFNVPIVIDLGTQENISFDGIGFTAYEASSGSNLSMAPNTSKSGPTDRYSEDPDTLTPYPAEPALQPVREAPTNFEFHNFYHPFTETMLRQLRKHGVKGLLDPIFNEDQDNRDLYGQSIEREYFEDEYSPTSYVVAEKGSDDQAISAYPKEAFDFKPGDGYSMYNWEVFYHAPMMIATRLMENQKFDEAKKWIEYIFNPGEVDYTDTKEDPIARKNDTPKRFWKIKPFKDFCDQTTMDRIVTFIKGGNEDLNKLIEVWQNNPFSPYAIGRMRPLSLMKKAVMLYLDNMIAWGDYLFARDTMESINEAALLYINAAKILGKKPIEIKRNGNSLSIGDSMDDDMGQAKLMLIEDALPAQVKSIRKANISSAINALNLADFCLPANDKMISYWDIVYDRLYKVRNCMNLSGLVRKLPLFEPPIDPSILVRAFASGSGVAGVLSELYGSRSPYRYAYLYQKAVEYTNDVKSLGNSILSALEKKDGETMSLLRSNNEINLLNKQLDLKEKSIEEAQLGIESLRLNKEITNERYLYHKNRVRRNDNEKLQMMKTQRALKLSMTASTLTSVAGGLSLLPNLSSGTAGLGPVVEFMFGGDNLSQNLSYAASIFNQWSSRNSSEAGIAGMQASNERRDEEWDFQEKNALRELDTLDKQMESADLRLSVAEKDLELHKLQIKQAEEVMIFMEDKFTNKELYSWMIGKLSKLYFDAYNIAYKMAKKAENAYFYELGIEQGTNQFVKFGNWDNLKRGLLSGEGLHNDLKRMDVAYIENNVREFELTKQFSLALFNAEQLIQLREKGTCDFDISEMLYDLDHPGHYYRRIKSVSLTIPCIAGPFTSISGKLTLLKSKTRKSATVSSSYQNQESNNFNIDTQGLQSIATSTGQNDSGVFELNFNDSRYLPFEYAGAISSWRFELPNKENTSADTVFRQFDYDSISDVIVTVRYLARDGGDILKEKALDNLKNHINKAIDYTASTEGLYRVVSMKSEFPTELHHFLNPIGSADHSTTFDIGSKHFPFTLRTVNTEFLDLVVLVKLKEGYTLATVPSNPDGLISVEIDTVNYTNTLTTTLADSNYGGLCSTVFGDKSTSPIGSWKLDALVSDWDISGSSDPKDAVEDILLVIKYKKS